MQTELGGRATCSGKPRKASRTHSKAHNLRMLLQSIAEHEQISRADLARATGLTRASVSTLITELIDDRWVVEAGLGSSSVGKRPTMLELDRESRDIIVIDLSARPMVGTVVDIAGRPRFDPIAGSDYGNDIPMGNVVAESMAALLSQLLQRSERQLLGISVACPGVIDNDGRVRESVPLGWRDFDAAGHIRSIQQADSARHNIDSSQTAAQTPIQIVNDSQAVALAVHRQQSTDSTVEPVDDLVAIRLSTGIGAGIVLRGQLHLGPHRAAGEVAPLVKALMGRSMNSPLELDETNTVRLTAELGSAIGSAAGHLANVFDVSKVFLATEPAASNDAFEQATTTAADEAVLSSLRSELHVETIVDDGLALKGAAAYLLQTETGLTTG